MKRFRNIFRYIIIVGINAAIMLSFHSYINFIIMLFLILFPIYSVFGVYSVAKKISLELTLPREPMDKGTDFYVGMQFQNPTIFPIVNATLKLRAANAFYGEEGEHILNVPIRCLGGTQVKYPITMDSCGRFSLEVVGFHLTDLLGVLDVKVPCMVSGECLVVPVGADRNQEAGRLYQQGVSEAMESKEKGYDFSEISGIREYIPGDKLQNIHWKLSVKRDELMVKERVSVSPMQLNVVVELARDENQGLEQILELADSVTRAFVKQNLPFTVYYYSTNLGHLQDCYIGNEVERKAWLECMLYDHCYGNTNFGEDSFLRQYPSGGTYLYIGYGMAQGDLEHIIPGSDLVCAQLKTY